MQITTLYTTAGTPATPNPIVTAAIAELNTAAKALNRAAYGLAFLNDGAPTELTDVADAAEDLARSTAHAAGSPMADAIELSDMVEGFRDTIARRELQAMIARAGGALRLGAATEVD